MIENEDHALPTTRAAPRDGLQAASGPPITLTSFLTKRTVLSDHRVVNRQEN